MASHFGMSVGAQSADPRPVASSRGRIGLLTSISYRVSPSIGLAVCYVLLYLGLDRISFIETLHGLDITPWNPPAGVTLALLIAKGPRFVPAVFVAVLLSNEILSLVDLPLVTALTGAAVVAAGYGAAAQVLRHFLLGKPCLQDVRGTVLFFFVAVVASGIVSGGFIATYAVTGVVPWHEFRNAAFRFWIGDAVGIVAMTPLLLALADGITRFRVPTWNWQRVLEIAAQWLTIGASMALVFGFNHHRTFELFYLLFMPLVWIAARYGLPGASAAVFTIQTGLIAALEFQDRSTASVLAFQLVMFAVATTGLLLGASVTERHRIGRALAESRKRLANIINTARDGMLTLDAQGVIRSANPEIDRMFKYPHGALIGRDISELLPAPGLLGRLTEITSHLDRHSPPWELDALRPDGTACPVEVTIGRFGSVDDGRYTLVVRDITLRRQAEARAAAHQSELAHVSRVSLAGEMASSLAHELNQPLTSITSFGRGCLRLLRQCQPEANLLREGVAEIVAQAERASDIISGLREFLRTGSYETAVIQIETIINSAIALARIDAAQNQIELAVDIEPNLPSIKADRIQIEQVVLNLLRNAMDAIGDRDRRIVRIEAGRTPGSTVRVTVSDSGLGLAEDVVGRIFEPFVTTKSSGMGLGLSISRSIAEAQGGRLWLVRSSGAGAVFAFELPAHQAAGR
jgi:two-component system sensor kinase FixL